MHPTPLHHRTPLIHSPRLSERAGTEVRLKMESAQPTGSFKLRGMGHACQTLAARGAKGFVSSSGGNAGIAAAYAGSALKLPVNVVVPETTTAHAQALIHDQGAHVTVLGESWQEANAHAETLAGRDHPLLHPFDDELLWQGHATLIDEVLDAGFVPDAVVASVGGGGLLCGLIEGLAPWLQQHPHHRVRNGRCGVPARSAGRRSPGQSGTRNQRGHLIGRKAGL